MTATVRVLPDGSVAVTDGGLTFPPLPPDAVQAIAAKAQASANAAATQQLTEALTLLAGLLSEVGSTAEATVDVTATAATAVVDQASFSLAVSRFPDGAMDAQGRWVDGPMTIGQAQRTVTDGVTTAGAVRVTSATANFNTYDRGRAITGGSIPTGTTIAAVIDAQTADLSQAPTSDGAAVTFTIG